VGRSSSITPDRRSPRPPGLPPPRIYSSHPPTPRAGLGGDLARGVSAGHLGGSWFPNVLSAAVNEGVLALSPARGVNLPPLVRDEMRFLSPAQIRELAEAIDPLYSALVLAAGYSGLRFGELAALKSGRVDFGEGTLSVVETLGYVSGHLVAGPPKTAAARRIVALPRFLVDVLKQPMAMFPGDDDLVFPSSGGGSMRASNFRRRYWQPAVETSVGSPMRFHDLRHSHVAVDAG